MLPRLIVRFAWLLCGLLIIATVSITACRPDPPAPVAGAPTSQLQPASVLPQNTAATPVLLRLRDDLDDPLGYCIDVRGFGAGIRLDADLQAHSCKSGSPDDQSFVITGDSPNGRILLVEYDVCLAAPDPTPGASILLRPCDDPSVSQEFALLSDGKLRLLAGPDPSPMALCVGVADGSGEPAGGRNHLRRDLILQDCEDAAPALTAWKAMPTR